MKHKLLVFIAGLLTFTSEALVGCDFLDDFADEENDFPKIDNAVDLNEFTPTPDDDNEYLEDETYYTSASVDLVTEINGNYSIDRPFTLDKENENKRIYRNVYFYVDDFFQVLYYKDPRMLGTVYAILSDETDQEYAEVEYGSSGSGLQINIKQRGVYNLILDVETFGIDMVKVADIDTPVYETIKSCELNIHVSASNHTYTPMSLDETTNEYYILADVPSKASIGFYSSSHNSHYKMTVDNKLTNKLVYWDSVNPAQTQVHVGGTYKIYFNAKTYVLRLELQNPDTASYYCQVEWKQGNELTPVSSSTPYLFEYELVSTGFADLPNFYPYLGLSYDLTVLGDEEYVRDDYVREEGTYKLTVNLKEFTLTVTKLS